MSVMRMDGKTSTGIGISVIVPVLNARPHIGHMLESLVNQECGEPSEIVLVDNGSTDDSISVASQISGRVAVRAIRATAKAGAAYARNVGVGAAVGDKLLFVDADDAVAPGYVAAMADALDSFEIVTSRVDSYALNAEWLHAAHGKPWQAHGVSTFFDFLPAAGVNIGIRRALFEETGGFPEDCGAAEDIALSWRVQQAGRSIQFIGSAVYYYRYRDTLSALYRQCSKWGTSNVMLYRRFRESGMPPRTIRDAVRDWRAVLVGLSKARSKATVALVVMQLGYCVGRLTGSLRYRRLYL